MKINIGKQNGEIIKFVAKESEIKCDNLKYLVDNNFFNRENGETFLNLKCENPVLLTGLGKPDDITIDTLKVAGLNAGKEANRLKLEKVTVCVPELKNFTRKETALAIIEGLLNSTYNYDNYKKTKCEINLKEITACEDCTGDLNNDDIEELMAKWSGIVFARNLVNTPANDLYPETLANEAMKLKELGVDVKVFGKEEIEKIGMKAYLSVARGSNREPKLIVMEYMKGEGAPISFVGKGLTYDSGGYSLKPNDGMKTMKSDMGGSAAVIGAIKAIAEAKLKVNIVGVVAACENMLDGGAYKPGDIIGSLRGLSIEVDNTDAEGRLTLADAVTYSEMNYSPKLMVELATLTGACVVAMGEHRSGVLGNDAESIEHVLKCAKLENERAWSLPYGKDYQDLNKSDIADIKNSGGRWGGASSAGEFVGAFIEKTKWVHVDIAGPAFNSAPFMEQPKGGTGHMVKTLYRIAKENK